MMGSEEKGTAGFGGVRSLGFANQEKNYSQEQQSLFTKPNKKTSASTEASFKVAQILTKNK